MLHALTFNGSEKGDWGKIRAGSKKDKKGKRGKKDKRA